MRSVGLAAFGIVASMVSDLRAADAPESWTREGVEVVAFHGVEGHWMTSGAIRLSTTDGLMRLEVTGSEGGSVRMPDETVYDNRGVVCLRVMEVTGATLGLQMMCWRRDGAFVRAVTLLNGIATPGDHAMPFMIHQEMIPEETAKISFRVQVAGADGQAAIAGLFLGRNRVTLPAGTPP